VEPDTDVEDDNIDFDSYPKFTLDVEYPLTELSNLNMNERKQFFFNETIFISILKPHLKKNDFSSENLVNKTADEVDKYYRERNARIDHNISTTIELLFPTKYPVINDNHTSLDYIKNQGYKYNFWIDPVNTNYSYLNINSTKYTVKKTVWLNDIINHPDYRKMIMKYRDFYKWVDETANGLQFANKKFHNEKQSKQQDIIRQFNIFQKALLVFNVIKNNKQSSGNRTAEYNKLYMLTNKVDVNGVFDENFKKFIEESNDGKIDEFTWFHTVRDKKKTQDKNIFGLTQGGKKYNWTDPEVHDFISHTEYLITLITEYSRFVDKQDKILQYLTIPLNKITATDVKINEFKMIMRELSETMSSSNVELQRLIDATYKSDNNIDATKFYELLYTLVNEYIKQESNYVKPSGVDETEGLYVGISTIPRTGKKDLRRIYLMIDLIKGEINNENKSKLYCQYNGDFLGNTLEHIINEDRHPDVTEILTDHNRKMYSIKDSKSIDNTIFSSLKTGSNLVTGSPINIDNKPLPTQNSTKKINDINFKRLGEMDDIKDAFVKIKKKFNTFMNINEYDILGSLVTINKFEAVQHLIEIIEEWNKSISSSRDNSFMIKVAKGITSTNGINASIDILLASRNIEYDLHKQSLLKAEVQINTTIVIPILKKIQTYEANKPEKTKGGKTKKKYKKPKYKKSKKYRVTKRQK
jgi:hypothetical protein